MTQSLILQFDYVFHVAKLGTCMVAEHFPNKSSLQSWKQIIGRLSEDKFL